jgi:peptidyl-tRNA hydrolase
VLQPFTPQEEAFILPVIDRAADAVEVVLSEGVEKAMILFHTSDQTIANEKQY